MVRKYSTAGLYCTIILSKHPIGCCKALAILKHGLYVMYVDMGLRPVCSIVCHPRSYLASSAPPIGACQVARPAAEQRRRGWAANIIFVNFLWRRRLKFCRLFRAAAVATPQHP